MQSAILTLCQLNQPVIFIMSSFRQVVLSVISDYQQTLKSNINRNASRFQLDNSRPQDDPALWLQKKKLERYPIPTRDKLEILNSC